MPVITIAMHSTTEEVKKNLIEGLTAAAVAATSVPQEKFVVFVEEYETDAIGIGGRTLKAIKAAQQGAEIAPVGLPSLTGRGIPGGSCGNQPRAEQFVPALGFLRGHFHSPGDGPGPKGFQQLAQFNTHRRKGVAFVCGAHKPGLAQFFKAAIEHRRRDGFASLLQSAEGGGPATQLPDDAHGPPLAQEVKKRHERHAAT